ncbi:nonstructural protein [Capybara microvirus Cap3_SP_472]|nr:nonstructural protein [Capybara microvirus Cap3_SP_472]
MNGLYNIKDLQGTWGDLMNHPNDNQAIRAFEWVMKTNAFMGANKHDFEFWKVGEYNQDTGEFTMYPKADWEILRKGEDINTNERDTII